MKIQNPIDKQSNKLCKQMIPMKKVLLLSPECRNLHGSATGGEPPLGPGVEPPLAATAREGGRATSGSTFDRARETHLRKDGHAVAGRHHPCGDGYAAAGAVSPRSQCRRAATGGVVMWRLPSLLLPPVGRSGKGRRSEVRWWGG